MSFAIAFSSQKTALDSKHDRFFSSAENNSEIADQRAREWEYEAITLFQSNSTVPLHFRQINTAKSKQRTQRPPPPPPLPHKFSIYIQRISLRIVFIFHQNGIKMTLCKLQPAKADKTVDGTSTTWAFSPADLPTCKFS
jgi:hypothetical protein